MKPANYIAKVWKSCLTPDLSDRGWTSSRQIIWTTEEFLELLSSSEDDGLEDKIVDVSEDESYDNDDED